MLRIRLFAFRMISVSQNQFNFIIEEKSFIALVDSGIRDDEVDEGQGTQAGKGRLPDLG